VVWPHPRELPAELTGRRPPPQQAPGQLSGYRLAGPTHLTSCQMRGALAQSSDWACHCVSHVQLGCRYVWSSGRNRISSPAPGPQPEVSRDRPLQSVQVSVCLPVKPAKTDAIRRKRLVPAMCQHVGGRRPAVTGSCRLGGKVG
jgi:hypothetical protein